MLLCGQIPLARTGPGLDGMTGPPWQTGCAEG